MPKDKKSLDARIEEFKIRCLDRRNDALPLHKSLDFFWLQRTEGGTTISLRFEL